MPRYDECEFGSTHNSYSGGARGSLDAQLSNGIRCVELDVHDNGYRQLGDFRVGHAWPGNEVDHGPGNPPGLGLRDWLDTINTWSAVHPGHGPVTVILDLKDDLTDNDDGGDLEDLNQSLRSVFGLRLFTPEHVAGGPWPDVATLRGRILCVLSGNTGTRVSYRWTRGSSPSISAEDGGRVVLSYRSTAGDLRCWSGRIDLVATGIEWRRRSTYRWGSPSVSDPAVAMNDDGWVIAVHGIPAQRDFPAPVVESCVGRLQSSDRISWYSSERYALGGHPTIQVSGDSVRSVFREAGGTGLKLCTGTLNRQKRKIEWKKAKATAAAPFPRDGTSWQGNPVRCSVGPKGEITFRLGPAAAEPVRFRQVAFLERQEGDAPAFLADAPFFAAAAGSQAALRSARLAGRVVRAWSFHLGDETTPRANMAATDDPGNPRFIASMAQWGVVT